MWHSAPNILPVLTAGRVHLWRADLRTPRTLLADYHQLLSVAERKRAERFYFERDRNAFITARAILRTLLGNYLQASPSSFSFTYNEYGKPLLDEAGDLSFNLSHSAHCGLFGFTRRAVIGVDVEQIQRDLDWTSVAKQVFAPAEREAIQQLPKDRQVPAFFRCWTSKEAFIKADGRGISLPLDQFEVEVDPNKPARIKAVHWQSAIREEWDIHSFAVMPDIPGAIVLTQRIASIQFFDWRN